MKTPIQKPSPVSAPSPTSHATASGPTSLAPGTEFAPPPASPGLLNQPTLLYLQRTAGNRAVSQLLSRRRGAENQGTESQPARSQAAPPQRPAPSVEPPLIQRRGQEEIIQRSQITAHTSARKQTPNAILAAKFGDNKQYRLSAVPRTLADDPEADDTVLSLAQWKFGSAYKMKQVDRAHQVKATIEGDRRTTGARKSDSMQTEIGNLGEQERAILGRSPDKSYEGGHLVSDKLLGPNSYQEWNLAPQARSLNSPYYRGIEDMIVHGAVHNETKTADEDVPIHMVVDVEYSDDPYTITVQELLDRNVIPKALGKGHETEILTFNRHVPHQWKIAAKIDPKFAKDYSFPTKELTDLMTRNTIAKTKPFLKRQPSQEFEVQPSGLQKAYDKYVIGGGQDFDVTAEQHFPDPTNTKATGKKTLPTAPPLRKSLFAEPFKLADVREGKKKYDMFMDTLGLMDSRYDELDTWGAAAFYISEAVGKSPTADRPTLLQMAVQSAGSERGKLIRGASASIPAGLRTKLKTVLYYDCYVKLTDEEVNEEAELELPEYEGPPDLKPKAKPKPTPAITTPSITTPMITTPMITTPMITTPLTPSIIQLPTTTPSLTPLSTPSPSIITSPTPTTTPSLMPSTKQSPPPMFLKAVKSVTPTPKVTPKSLVSHTAKPKQTEKFKPSSKDSSKKDSGKKVLSMKELQDLPTLKKELHSKTPSKSKTSKTLLTPPTLPSTVTPTLTPTLTPITATNTKKRQRDSGPKPPKKSQKTDLKATAHTDST